MTAAKKNTPTLLVMTRGAHHERRRKHLLPPGLEGFETAFHEQALVEIVRSGHRAGCRVIVSSPSPIETPAGVPCINQRGDTFGERFADALEHCRELTPGPLLVVGTDTPELGQAHLEQALAGLRKEPESVILSPATDGGFYLLALAHGREVNAIDWQAVSWCTSSTRETLCASIGQAGRRVRFLRPQADLDSPGDFERWLAAASHSWQARLAGLRRILAQRLKAVAAPDPSPFESPAPVCITGRAPPR